MVGLRPKRLVPPDFFGVAASLSVFQFMTGWKPIPRVQQVLSLAEHRLVRGSLAACYYSRPLMRQAWRSCLLIQ